LHGVHQGIWDFKFLAEQGWLIGDKDWVMHSALDPAGFQVLLKTLSTSVYKDRKKVIDGI
jgi:hypothetical protein